MDEFDYWRLCDELSIHQAALLIAGISPSSEAGANCANWKTEERPMGYEAAKSAVRNALRRELIMGEIVPENDYDINGQPYPMHGTVCIFHSLVDVDSLKSWLISRGFNQGFFFPVQPETTEYLNPQHPRYAPKLAAAVRAWEAVTASGKISPKKALDKWLREHAAQFALSDEDGNPINQAIEECSKIANWQPGGGAPKTPGA